MLRPFQPCTDAERLIFRTYSRHVRVKRPLASQERRYTQHKPCQPTAVKSTDNETSGVFCNHQMTNGRKLSLGQCENLALDLHAFGKLVDTRTLSKFQLGNH